VISQIYGGGGNAGAPFRNDFVELFNRGKSPVNVSGWSIQYSSAAGTDWQVTPIQGVVAPGHYYLVEEAVGANTAATVLPEPDATGVIPMSATAGKLALLRNSSPLNGATPAGPDLADFVPYSSLANTTAAIRRGNGCADEFQTAAPRPRNSASAAQSCDTEPVVATPLRISEIQGSGAESPVVGRLVVTRGIVTGRKSNGFFIQSAAADDDGDARTSEGVFVFTSSAPPAAAARGNLVEVTGTVSEFRPSADPTSAPLTELIDPSAVLIAANQTIPTEIPLATISDLETVEGMRVSATNLRVVGPTGGTMSEPEATATTNGVFYGIEQGGIRPFTASTGTLGSRLIRVDSRALGRPILDVKSGDTVGPLSGPLDFGFNTYTIDNDTQSLSFSPTPPLGIVPRTSDEFAITSMNLQRLFDDQDDPRTSDAVLTPAAFQTRIERVAGIIRGVLQSPEIVAVEEVENLNVLQALARAAGGYDAFLLEGNDIGGIDVGVMVRRDRVVVKSFSQEG
jgi:hypothetical protein